MLPARWLKLKAKHFIFKTFAKISYDQLKIPLAIHWNLNYFKPSFPKRQSVMLIACLFEEL